MRKWIGSVVAVVVLVTPVAAGAQKVLVSAAASLTDVFRRIATDFEKKYPSVQLTFNFGASGALAAQIRQGAPVDVFVSASAADMDTLEKANQLSPNTRRNVAQNELMAACGKGSAFAPRNLAQLADPRIKKIALGDPARVPAGRYALEALTKAGLWERLKARFVYAADVRQARAWAELGEVDIAFVYATDLKGSGLISAFTVPDKLHAPIVYPAAVITGSPSMATAREFVNYLCGPAAVARLKAAGFRK